MIDSKQIKREASAWANAVTEQVAPEFDWARVQQPQRRRIWPAWIAAIGITLSGGALAWAITAPAQPTVAEEVAVQPPLGKVLSPAKTRRAHVRVRKAKPAAPAVVAMKPIAKRRVKISKPQPRPQLHRGNVRFPDEVIVVNPRAHFKPLFSTEQFKKRGMRGTAR